MRFGARAAITFPLALLIFLALLTFWINRAVQPPVPKLDGSSRHDPDYIMSNFVTTQTDVNGDLRYKLAAIEMRHFPDDDTTELQRPRYTQFAVGKPYTEVQGLRGFVSSDGEEVQLVDNVKVTRQAFADKGEMTVETDYLKIRPNEELVTTDRPVVIRQAPKTVIYATGMIYEKKQKTVTLLNRVRAHYERPAIAGSAGKSNPATTTSKTTAAETQTKNNTSKNSQLSKKLTTEQEALKQEKSNINDVRVRRRYE
jgi:lipopolysaccharide export system protein LptC